MWTKGYGEEYADFIDLTKLGGILVKGTTLNHREGNPYPRMAETPSGMLNAVGLQNKGIDYFVETIYPRIKDIDTNIIVNVSGSTIEDYCAVAEKVNALENIPAIELNVSCPNVKQGGCFDTAFHSSMKPEAYLYPIPYEYYDKYRVRRYGFHGTSHKYVSQRAAAMLGKNIEDVKIITCHLGNGASIAAINGGKCVDTSMGFTPLEGLIMGTRCGDIDAAILPFLMEKEGLDAKGLSDLMNKKSGVYGMTGISSDFRDIEDAAAAGEEKAQVALDAYAQRVKKYIGAYAAEMNGVDAVVFTAGVGENGAAFRKALLDKIACLGVKVNNGIVNFDIEKELGVEIVGETKMKISIEDDEELVEELDVDVPAEP